MEGFDGGAANTLCELLSREEEEEEEDLPTSKFTHPKTHWFLTRKTGDDHNFIVLWNILVLSICIIKTKNLPNSSGIYPTSTWVNTQHFIYRVLAHHHYYSCVDARVNSCDLIQTHYSCRVSFSSIRTQ